MQLIRGIKGWGARGAGCAVTIGTYDGLHLGHQALLARLKEHAARLQSAAVLLTFEPMPREFLAPAAPPARLTSSFFGGLGIGHEISLRDRSLVAGGGSLLMGRMLVKPARNADTTPAGSFT